MTRRGALRPATDPGRASEEAIVALSRATDRVKRVVGSALEPRGLTGQQYNVLRILRGAGEALPVLEVAERMLERTPGITRLLDRLDHKGLVSRERCAGDRRQVLCSITPRGLRQLEELDGVVDAADEQAFASLDPRELRELIRLLDAVAEEP
ncbi:MAG: MarR family winged helix-turn-helix transcriptional regulator [Thermoanaerobaculia bacterium]